MGTETPTNLPFWSAGPVFGTKLPRRMPMVMARKIQRARKRSRRPREWKAESLVVDGGVGEDCFSGSEETEGFETGRMGTGWIVLSFCILVESGPVGFG